MSQEGFDRLKSDCINTGLCVECGACALVCPAKAIELKEYKWGRNPELVKACVDGECNLCRQVCPAREVKLTEIEKKYFGHARDNSTVEKEIGIVKNVYTGYAVSQGTRDSAVSGGVVSAILISALERGDIDGAVLAGFSKEEPWKAKAFVARTKAEILACAGSKYQPHPQLLGLADALKMGLHKLAITTTPCHAVAVRTMMMQEEFREFGSRIALLISNICGAHWSIHGTEWLITEAVGAKLSDVGAIKYRARPFPGDFQVTLKDGTVQKSPFVNHLLGQLAKFTPEECRLCLEKVGNVADIVVGDTWHHPTLHPGLLMSYTEEDKKKDRAKAEGCKGLTALIVRSDVGQKFVDAAIKEGAIDVFPDDHATAEKFLTEVHKVGKPVCNGPVVEARVRHGRPVREFI